MSRLTTKTKLGDYIFINGEQTCLNTIATKLGKLEDIESELGCPLDVVFKALKEQYIIFEHKKGIENPMIKLEKHKIAGLIFTGKDFELWLYDNYYGDEFCVDTKDYKKTWLLKEDLSE